MLITMTRSEAIYVACASDRRMSMSDADGLSPEELHEHVHSYLAFLNVFSEDPVTVIITDDLT